MDPRIFVSYARKDGLPFATKLRRSLVNENLSVWQDIVSPEGGRDWWSQIEQAIRSRALQHFVLVVTPAALASQTVRREIRLARQEGKTVSPVKGPGLGDIGKLPRWLGQVYDLDIPEHRTTFIRVLQEQSRQKRVPMMAPEPPTDFVERPEEFNTLKRLLLDTRSDSIAITAAMRGAGGYGKTTLAMALAHDPDIQDAYFDGVLWVELAEKPHDLVSILSDLVEILTGYRPGFQNINAAATKLTEALGDRRILLVIDDVWHERDVYPFLQGGPETTRLITTRIDNILPIDCLRLPVDALQSDEALTLLAKRLPVDQVAPLRPELRKLAARGGEWAILLKLINGFLCDRVLRAQQPLVQAIESVNRRLDMKGLVAFDASNELDRTKAVARTVGVSLELLDDAARARFCELGVFPEDVEIPIDVVTLLWTQTGALDEIETEDLLTNLYRLSLLLNLDLNRRIIRLHDTMRQFLRYETSPEKLRGDQKRLLIAFDGIDGLEDRDSASRRYFYLYRLDHLGEAGDRKALDALLLDPAWLVAKLIAIGDPRALIADYDRHGMGDLQKLIGRTLRLMANICGRDPVQLIPQLLGRLTGNEGLGANAFLEAARRQLRRPAILTQHPSLTPPGAETDRVEGLKGTPTAMCMLPDGRLVTGLAEFAMYEFHGLILFRAAETIQIWDLETGSLTAPLRGHHDLVSALCLLPDGRLASSSQDRTIRLWDVKAGTEIARFEVHSNRVTALCVLTDNRLAAGDTAIRMWDVESGVETGQLSTDDSQTTAFCVLRDGRLAAGLDNGTIQILDVNAGIMTARLEGHSHRITALCELPDGRLASSSWDRTLRLWDLESCDESARLPSKGFPVTSMCVLFDGRLAAGYWDEMIRLWDVKAGIETACLEGHSRWVTALCMLPDGRLASGADDETMRLWDVNIPPNKTRRVSHDARVSGLCVLANDRLASSSWDRMIRVWDATTGAQIACLEADSATTAVCRLPDGRVAVGYNDHKIRLWDIERGIETAVLSGHHGRVSALCVLADGQLASGSNETSIDREDGFTRLGDRSIRIWDVTTGVQTISFEARGTPFEHAVTALCILSDGRLVSGTDSDTFHLWDLKTQSHVACIEGPQTVAFRRVLEGRLDYGQWTDGRHKREIRVSSLLELPNGWLAVGYSDGTIRLWEVGAGIEIACLTGHSDVVEALCVLSDGRLVSGSRDKTIRLWDCTARRELTRLEIDGPVACLAVLQDRRFIAGDSLGHLHWLEVAD